MPQAASLLAARRSCRTLDAMQHIPVHERRLQQPALALAGLCVSLAAQADPASMPGIYPAPVESSASSPLGVNFEACENAWLVFTSIQFPRQLERSGVAEGSVSVAFTVGRDGAVGDLQAVRYSHIALVRPVLEATATLVCPRLREGTRVTLPISLKVERRRAS